jgi:hypothetical protein
VTEIGRLCVRVSGADAQASASRTALAVRPLDLDSPSVPERAILCIRRLDDPLPGGIDIRSTHTRPTRWEHAAREAIGALYRSAPRLLRDDVSPHANAVVFEDRAELLACAAQSLQSRAWWWTDVIASPLTVDAVAREWLRTPHYIPSAIALLDAPSLRTFLHAIEVTMALRLTQRVLEVHGIASIARVLVSFPAVVTALSAATATSIARVALEEPSNIAIECRVFAMIALALHESPVMTRRILEKQLLTRDPERPPITQIEPTSAQIALSPEPVIAREATDTLSPQEPHNPQVPVERRALSPSNPRRESHTPRDEHDGGLRARRSTITETTRSAPAAPTTTPEWQIAQTTPTRPLETPISASIPAPTLDAIHTPYAGLFFLLNAAIALGYYDPYGRGEDIDLDVWEFLAMCGNEWIPKFEDDALFAFLDREGGCRLPVGVYREPAGLASAFPPDNRQPATDNRKEWLVAIREHITDALPGIESPETFLLTRAGTIVVTPAHVDVHFILETHPIEIRIAGLDRDPGWIPAAGRHVAFHFD